MCILIHHAATTSFTDEMLDDFYQHNPDGFGVMYGDGKKIHVTKSLGSDQEVKDLYRDIAEGRECIIHYRMKTHGNIDTANCHPYRVTDELWVAHNGILSASNPLDKNMSDTWHLIEYIIKPIAESNVDLIFTEEWQQYCGALIGGGNKLGFAHADGRVAIINRKSGVEYLDAWLSNTYAWSAAKHGFGYGKTKSTYDWYGNRGSLHLDWYKTYNDDAPDYLPITAKQDDQYDYNKLFRKAYKAWRKGSEALIKWVEEFPDETAYLLSTWYTFDEKEIDEIIFDEPSFAAEYLTDIFESSSESAQEAA